MNILKLIIGLTLGMGASAASLASDIDSVPSGFTRRLSWRLGAELSPSWVPQTNGYLKGDNDKGRRVTSAFAAAARADFSFAPSTKEGMLYPGLYQGVGVGVNTFFSGSVLGAPVTAYVYQGAPITHFSERLWLGYEWKFGAAFGWKHYEEGRIDNNAAVSTSVTAMLGIGLKIHYALTDRWTLSAGLAATHYSNGNTSLPNAGVNSIGASFGVAYALTAPKRPSDTPAWLADEADRGRWLYDIIVYGAWRRRVVNVGDGAPQLCPGRFGILGLQFSPLRALNRWVAVGPSLDLQWDESAGIAPYWIEDTTDNFIKFERPPFGKQLSVGISAHAELTMPIFTVNAGLGYDVVNPKGDKRFYQSLTLKTFVTGRLFLNVGYRLGDFKDPQNLMLGFGVRL